MTLYVEAAEVMHAVGLELSDTADDAHLERAAEAASRAVEKFCRGRRFWLDETPVARLFSPRMPDRLYLRPDLATLTTLKVDGDELVEGEDFRLAPLNAAADGEPFTRVAMIPPRRLPLGEARVEIAGRWGWPEVPAEVEQAALLVATRLFKRTKEAPFGVAPLSLMEGMGVRLLAKFDADGEVLLRPLRWPPAVG